MNTKCWDNIQPIKPQLFSEASLCQCLNVSVLWFLVWLSIFPPCAGAARGPWCFWHPQSLILQAALFSACVKGAGRLSTLQLDGNSFIKSCNNEGDSSLVIDDWGSLIPSPLTLLLLFLILDQNSLLEVLPSNKLSTGLDLPMLEPLFSVDLRWMQISTAFYKSYSCQLMVDLKS